MRKTPSVSRLRSQPTSIIPRVLTVVLGGGLLLTPQAGCKSRSRAAPEAGAVEEKGPSPSASLKIEDLSPGGGKTATKGNWVTIHYTGWLNGAKFDSSRTRDPLRFKLGAAEVLRGWDEGISGMKVGGTRKLTLPPEFGYGAKGSLGGAIPPNSVLVFEIELVDVKD